MTYLHAHNSRDDRFVSFNTAHDGRVIIECEKAGVEVDFYRKTLHSLDYYTAPRPGETGALGPHDNSWCQDPQAVIDFMAQNRKPWIAFKILAAGALQPRAAFPFAFNSGADFILVGMFDWQVVEDTKLAKVPTLKKPGFKELCERLPAKGQVERMARIHRELARSARIQSRSKGKLSSA